MNTTVLSRNTLYFFKVKGQGNLTFLRVKIFLIGRLRTDWHPLESETTAKTSRLANGRK